MINYKEGAYVILANGSVGVYLRNILRNLYPHLIKMIDAPDYEILAFGDLRNYDDSGNWVLSAFEENMNIVEIVYD